MPTNCPITGEPLQSGETVSRTAIQQTVTLTSNLETLMSEVDYALTGLRHGENEHSAGIAGSKPPLNVGLLDAADEMRDSINTWAAAVNQWASPQERYRNADWAQARAIISTNADKLRKWEEAPAFVDEIGYAIHRLERFASPRTPTTVFAGKCPKCGVDLLAGKDVEEVKCRDCGETVNVHDQRVEMVTRLSWAAYPRDTARRAAEVVTGRHIDPALVRKWVHRGKLTEIKQPGGPALVKVSDICDLADPKQYWREAA